MGMCFEKGKTVTWFNPLSASVAPSLSTYPALLIFILSTSNL
jgi:hypothetical protein